MRGGRGAARRKAAGARAASAPTTRSGAEGGGRGAGWEAGPAVSLDPQPPPPRPRVIPTPLLPHFPPQNPCCASFLPRGDRLRPPRRSPQGYRIFGSLRTRISEARRSNSEGGTEGGRGNRLRARAASPGAPTASRECGSSGRVPPARSGPLGPASCGTSLGQVLGRPGGGPSDSEICRRLAMSQLEFSPSYRSGRLRHTASTQNTEDFFKPGFFVV